MFPYRFSQVKAPNRTRKPQRTDTIIIDSRQRGSKEKRVAADVKFFFIFRESEVEFP